MMHWPAWLAGTLIVVCAAGVYLGAAGPVQQTRSTSSAPVSPERALLNQYCVGCHNSRVKTADLALDAVNVDSVSENPEVWEKVARRIRARAMPPAGRSRPDEAGYNGLLSYLETSLDRVAASRPNPGRTDTFRRLNRTEYQNAIRDLLALDVEVASLLPADDTSYGFDNVGVGGLSPTLMERYLSAAQKISRLAIGSPLRSPGGDTILMPPDFTQDAHVEGLPFGTRGGKAVHYNFPLDGDYEIQLRLTRDRNEDIEGLDEPHELEVTLDGARVELFALKPLRRGQPQEVDAALKTRIPVKAGPHVLGAAFLKRPSALMETERQPYAASFDFFFHSRTQPALYSVSITGPFNPSGAGDTPSRRRVFVCRPESSSAEPGCAKTIISTIVRRAYRRSVNDSDLQVLLGFYEEARVQSGFDAGIEMALRAILASPEFLFRIEQDPDGIAPNTPYRISDVELASRLSLFLWSSIPDDELLSVAMDGKLKEPPVLEQQINRMLADPRSHALVTNFAGQWLNLRSLAGVTPDPRSFPDFDDNLRQAFRRETEMFFESIAKENRSVLDLLTANYTFINERLARHYGIPNVYGSHFRRIELGNNSVRGGLFGQGSILTVSSYATRTSPVLRGKWLLENILGTPPPPPPPNVPPLQESTAGARVLSMRERMIQHRVNPVCASCHQLMDPAGLSMENFDAIGRWRTRDEGGNTIDASGGLPDGSTFEGVAGLRRALLNRPELFVNTLTEKLLTYALGRGLEYYDAAAIRQIIRNARNDQYRFSSIVQGVVTSTPFQMRISR
jgi:hypothetical protein